MSAMALHAVLMSLRGLTRAELLEVMTVSERMAQQMPPEDPHVTETFGPLDDGDAGDAQPT